MPPTPVSPALPPLHDRPPARLPGGPAPRPPGPRRSPYDGRVIRHSAEEAAAQAQEDRHYLATFGWTTAWYSVPVAIFSAWSLTFPADPGTACPHPTAAGCPSPRAAALAALIDGLPRVVVALLIALLVAGLIRLGSAAWRPVTVGFSSAVIGAGLATVLYSVLNSPG
jgi:hypothetical protein